VSDNPIKALVEAGDLLIERLMSVKERDFWPALQEFRKQKAAVEAMRPVAWWCPECRWWPPVPMDDEAAAEAFHRTIVIGCRAAVRKLVEFDI